MEDFINSLNAFIKASDKLSDGIGVDEIFLHPKVYQEVLRSGIGEHVRDRFYTLKRIEYKGVDLKEGRPNLLY